VVNVSANSAEFYATTVLVKFKQQPIEWRNKHSLSSVYKNICTIQANKTCFHCDLKKTLYNRFLFEPFLLRNSPSYSVPLWTLFSGIRIILDAVTHFLYREHTSLRPKVNILLSKHFFLKRRWLQVLRRFYFYILYLCEINVFCGDATGMLVRWNVIKVPLAYCVIYWYAVEVGN